MAASLNRLRCAQSLPQNVVQCLVPQLLRPSGNYVNYVPAMTMKKKHYDPRFRKYRKLKIDLRLVHEYEKNIKQQNMTPDEFRIYMKKRGEAAPTTFEENEIDISSTKEVLDEYVPPEGDGKSTLLSKKVLNKSKEWTKSKARTLRDTRLLKKWENGYDKKSLALELQDVYIEAQKLLMDYKNNIEKLFDYITDFAFPDMTYGLNTKTLRWEFIESIEPPQIVQVRVQSAIAKENYFCQLTLRMHSKQKLAIYDRFGRLMFGSEHLIKDVLEYIVFEKHIVNEYGRWRVHSKIIPTWLPVREPLITTIRKPKQILPAVPEDKEVAVKKEETVQKTGGDGDSGGPQLATA